MNSQLRLLTWNIQSGRGCDGKISLDRTIAHIQAGEQPDVICLQEVARYFNEYVCPTQPDQLALICAAFSDYTPIWGPALSWPGAAPDQRCEFGNLTLVRLPLLDQRIHVLPIQGELTSAKDLQTPRSAIETVVEWHGPIRILNTHLAYHDANERFAQLNYLQHYCQAKEQQATHTAPVGQGIYSQPFATRATLLCGDLNLDSRSEQYHWLEHHGWQDAFRQCHPNQPHTATCGIHDHVQWPQGPHCRDYIWLRQLGATHLTVDTHTDLSDHQPLLVTLEPSIHEPV
ncbi:endonuclease/exonuclease/phosphatase family protein [Nitrincola sp. MINF-07-Sa-05]|uniref:endonuclease/exonuclease/phosphatase family protein n=1 Tax=Nitrincola salilacus TaxID=3400273 RepID=UPI003917FD17